MFLSMSLQAIPRFEPFQAVQTRILPFIIVVSSDVQFQLVSRAQTLTTPGQWTGIHI